MARPAWLVRGRSLDKLGMTEAPNTTCSGYASEMDSHKAMPESLDRLRRLQTRLGPYWWHSALMFGAARLGDVLHIVVGLFLVPLYVSEDKLGAVLPLVSLGAFFAVPLSAAARTTSRYVTEFRVAGERGRIRAILRDLMILAALVSCGGLLLVMAGQSFIAARLKFEGRAIPLLVGGLIAMACWQPVLNLANQGLGHYYRITVSVMVRAASRLALALILLRLWGLEGYLALQILSGLIVAAFLLRGFREYFATDVVPVSNRALFQKVGRYFLAVLLVSGLFSLQAMMEPWIIRQRLPLEQSAAYYVASRFGMIPAYLAGAMTAFLFPMASERHDRGESAQGLQLQSLFVVMAVGLLVAAGLALFGAPLLDVYPPWRPHIPYVSLLWKTALVATGSSVILLYALSEMACRRFGFLWILAPVILLEIGGLYSLMGWTFYRDLLPAPLWESVNAFTRRDIGFIVSFMLGARGMVLLWMIPKLALRWD